VQIAVLTFDGFNELDSFVAAAILNRLKAKGWSAHITSPTQQVTSMNGVTIQRQRPLEFASEADAVLIGSGIRTREIAADPEMLSRIVLDPTRQLVGAQCSGTLLLAKLGLIGDLPACTDLTTKLGSSRPVSRSWTLPSLRMATWRRRGAAWRHSIWPRG
jgi:transcriptional regulator GlxA family with amidase domain